MALAIVNTGSDIESAISTFAFDYGFSPAEGNILFATITRAHSVSITVPDGSWTVLFGGAITDSSSVTLVAWKIAGASEPASSTWGGGANRKWAGTIIEISGQHATPIDNTSTPATGDGTSADTPSITPTQDNCMVVAGCGADNVVNFTMDADFDNSIEVTAASGGSCASGIGAELQTTATAATYNNSMDASEEWQAWSLSVAPAASGTSIPVFMNHYRQMQD